MKETAKLASLLCGREVTVKEAFMILVALKLAREGHVHREDNLLDAVAYLGAYNNMLEEESGPVEISGKKDGRVSVRKVSRRQKTGHQKFRPSHRGV